MVDWFEDFNSKFGQDPDLADIAKKKYYGHIQINFQDGKVTNCNMYQTKAFSVATPNSFSYSSYARSVLKSPK